MAEVFQALCRIAEIIHKLGAPEHPESQGQVDRQSQLIGQVRCMCERKTWPGVILIHNDS